MKYEILVDESAEGLEAQVNAKLSAGCSLVGGVTVRTWEYENLREGNTESGTTWIQAVICDDPSPAPLTGTPLQDG